MSNEVEPIISVELLSAVLSLGIKGTHNYYLHSLMVNDNTLFYRMHNDFESTTDDIAINLDTLGRKCKEYAFENGYLINSGISMSGHGYAELYSIESISSFEVENPIDFGDSKSILEVHHIILATQWVYDKVKGQQS